MPSKTRKNHFAAWQGAFNAPHSFVSDFDEVASPKPVRKGGVLFRQGQAARGVFLLRQGTARLSLHSPKGEKIHFRTVGPGYLLGVPAILGRRGYNFTAEVLQDAEVVFVKRKQFLEVLRNRPELSLHVVKMLSGELLGMPRTRRRIGKGPAISS